jgi:tetratricopeptide (TPR) repeat protein
MIVGLIAASVIVVAAGSLVYVLSRPPVLAERSQIVIADMVNSTGEAIFDGALKAALAVSMEESPFLNIVPDERLRETMKLMTRKPDEPVTGTVAREVCLRANAHAVLNSSIARLGSDYVVTLEALRCSDGGVLARRQEEAASKEQVLGAIRRATAKLRRRLGESRASLEKYNTSLEQATTPSLEALQAYSRARNLHREFKFQQAQVFYEQALKFDANFASARMWLSDTKQNQGDLEGARQDTITAYEMRDRASERERYLITANYNMGEGGDLDKAIEILDAFRIAYPNDGLAHAWLGLNYLRVGRFDECIQEIREALRLRGPAAAGYNNLSYCYTALNRTDEALRALQEGAESGFPVNHLFLVELSLLRGDMEGVEKWLARLAARSPEARRSMIYERARLKIYGGELRAARKLYRETLQFVRARRPAIPAQQFTVEARLGQIAEARAILRQYRSSLSFLDLADIGEFAQAEAMAAEEAKRFPNGTFLHRIDLPLLHAMIAMHRGDPAKAIEELRPAERYDWAHWPTHGVYVHYMRGYAYLATRDSKSAVAEFQRIVDHRALALLEITTTLAQVGLARAHAAAGERDKALHDYETFLNQWKNADADIPIYQQAKAEYAKLKSQH